MINSARIYRDFSGQLIKRQISPGGGWDAHTGRQGLQAPCCAHRSRETHLSPISLKGNSSACRSPDILSTLGFAPLWSKTAHQVGKQLRAEFMEHLCADHFSTLPPFPPPPPPPPLSYDPTPSNLSYAHYSHRCTRDKEPSKPICTLCSVLMQHYIDRFMHLLYTQSRCNIS